MTDAATTASAERSPCTGDPLRDLECAWALLQRTYEHTITDAFDVSHWLDFYRQALPLIRNIKQLAGLMVIEIERRIGEALEMGPEARGGDQYHQSKVADSATLSSAARSRRFRARRIYTHTAIVARYAEQTCRTGKAPSIWGALQAVEQVRRPTSTMQRIDPTRTAKSSQFSGAQVKSRQRAQQIRGALDAVATGEHYPDGTLQHLIRRHAQVDTEEFLKAIRLIPWLTIDRNER